jgi:hypothetical protein
VATAFSLLQFRDVETGSVWNMRGEAVAGELRGERLMQIPGYGAYWFAWNSFWPETAVWGESQRGLLPEDTFAQVPLNEYFPDVPKDAIPPLDAPRGDFGGARFDFDTGFLQPEDIVVGVWLNGEARAYPVKILNWHEIVNHTLGGREISLTYCPLTASGINFASDGIDFGNTGGLHNNNMVMYDRESESFWAQMKASSIIGDRVGERLELLPVFHGTWQAWKMLYPETEVLTTDTGYSRCYDSDIYISSGYTASTDVWFPQTPTIDERYHPKDMVLGLLGTDNRQGLSLLAAQSRRGAQRRQRRLLGPRNRRGISGGCAHGPGFDRRVGGRVLSFELVE